MKLKITSYILGILFCLTSTVRALGFGTGAALGLGGGGSSGARVCVIDTRNCNSNREVCGRFGQSNLCMRFQNNCQLQSANCAQSTSYTRVSIRQCANIGFNVRSTCANSNGGGTNPTNVGTNIGGSYGSTGFGTGAGTGSLSNLYGSGNSNVQPIVINTGRRRRRRRRNRNRRRRNRRRRRNSRRSRRSRSTDNSRVIHVTNE